MTIFTVATVGFVDDDRGLLTVRKRGTSRFMLPGGKIEPGESALDALVREVAEELGVVLDPATVTPLGTWTAPAANEADSVVVATAFSAPAPSGARASNEIAELRWIPLAELAAALAAAPGGVPADLAPLLALCLGPELLRRARDHEAESGRQSTYSR